MIDGPATGRQHQLTAAWLAEGQRAQVGIEVVYLTQIGRLVGHPCRNPALGNHFGLDCFLLRGEGAVHHQVAGGDHCSESEDNGQPHTVSGNLQMKVILAAFMGMAMASGCATSGGDMIIRVSGKIRPSSQPYALVPACDLSMLNEGGRVVSSKPVAGEFSVPMMVVAAPQSARYLLTVQCNDGRAFDAQAVQISSRRDYPRAFDMGELPER